MEQTVILQEKNHHRELILNRPDKLNALSPQLVNELHGHLKALAKEPPKVLLLKGAGTSFSSGHDMETVVTLTDPDALQQQLIRLQEVTSFIVHYPAPVIAEVRGYALGAGCEIALNCDLIYAAEDAKFGFPELSVGLSITQGSSYFLQRMVGSIKAKELIFFSERFDAQQAKELGMVNDIIAADQLSAHVAGKIEQLSGVNIRALSQIKKLFQFSAEHDLASSMNKEIETLVNLLR